MVAGGGTVNVEPRRHEDAEIVQGRPGVADCFLGPSERPEAGCADQLPEDGDWQGAAPWHRFLDAIERLKAQTPLGETRCSERAVIGGSHEFGISLFLP